MSPKAAKLLATFFYVGNFPVAPGSVASLVGSADDDTGSASVVWKSLIVQAERITNLPVKPPQEKIPEQ